MDPELVFVDGPAQAAEDLENRLRDSVGRFGGSYPDFHRVVAAWVVENVVMPSREEAAFLKALGLRKQTTPMGGWEVVNA